MLTLHPSTAFLSTAIRKSFIPTKRLPIQNLPTSQNKLTHDSFTLKYGAPSPPHPTSDSEDLVILSGNPNPALKKELDERLVTSIQKVAVIFKEWKDQQTEEKIKHELKVAKASYNNDILKAELIKDMGEMLEKLKLQLSESDVENHFFPSEQTDRKVGRITIRKHPEVQKSRLILLAVSKHSKENLAKLSERAASHIKSLLGGKFPSVLTAEKVYLSVDPEWRRIHEGGKEQVGGGTPQSLEPPSEEAFGTWPLLRPKPQPLLSYQPLESSELERAVLPASTAVIPDENTNPELNTRTAEHLEKSYKNVAETFRQLRDPNTKAKIKEEIKDATVTSCSSPIEINNFITKMETMLQEHALSHTLSHQQIIEHLFPPGEKSKGGKISIRNHPKVAETRLLVLAASKQLDINLWQLCLEAGGYTKSLISANPKFEGSTTVMDIYFSIDPLWRRGRREGQQNRMHEGKETQTSAIALPPSAIALPPVSQQSLDSLFPTSLLPGPQKPLVPQSQEEQVASIETSSQPVDLSPRRQPASTASLSVLSVASPPPDTSKRVRAATDSEAPSRETSPVNSNDVDFVKDLIEESQRNENPIEGRFWQRIEKGLEKGRENPENPKVARFVEREWKTIEKMAQDEGDTPRGSLLEVLSLKVKDLTSKKADKRMRITSQTTGIPSRD